jgi:hypothetical protein
MLNNDVFIFDNVVHMYDMSDDNLLSPTSATDRLGHLKIGARTRRGDVRQKSEPHLDSAKNGLGDGYARRWKSEDLASLLFTDGLTDMAMAQAVVLYDIYKNGFAPVQAQYEFARAYRPVLRRGGLDVSCRHRPSRRYAPPGRRDGSEVIQVLQRSCRRHVVALRRPASGISDVRAGLEARRRRHPVSQRFPDIACSARPSLSFRYTQAIKRFVRTQRCASSRSSC